MDPFWGSRRFARSQISKRILQRNWSRMANGRQLGKWILQRNGSRMANRSQLSKWILWCSHLRWWFDWLLLQLSKWICRSGIEPLWFLERVYQLRVTHGRFSFLLKKILDGPAKAQGFPKTTTFFKGTKPLQLTINKYISIHQWPFQLSKLEVPFWTHDQTYTPHTHKHTCVYLYSYIYIYTNIYIYLVTPSDPPMHPYG